MPTPANGPNIARTLATVALTVATLTTGASATPVRVTVEGSVESNGFTSGTFAGIPSGSPVLLTINLDSTNFIPSQAFPSAVRAYRFGPSDLTLTIGPVTTVPRADQAVIYFSLRNNDPAVDGVFISRGTDFDVPVPLAMTPNNFGIAFARGFDSPNAFPSLDILDCTGTWAFEDISSYNFTVALNENVTPLILAYERFTIAAACGGADVGSAGGQRGFDGALDNNDFIVFIDLFFAADPAADMGSTGGEPGPDGQFDNNDFVVFIDQFFAGC